MCTFVATMVIPILVMERLRQFFKEIQEGMKKMCILARPQQPIICQIISKFQLGDLNWFLFQNEPKSEEEKFPEKSVVVVTSKLDMVNLFDR